MKQKELFWYNLSIDTFFWIIPLDELMLADETRTKVKNQNIVIIWLIFSNDFKLTETGCWFDIYDIFAIIQFAK